jgi:hypothetical protein
MPPRHDTRLKSGAGSPLISKKYNVPRGVQGEFVTLMLTNNVPSKLLYVRDARIAARLR